VPVLLVVCLGIGASMRVGRGLWPFVLGSGVLDVVANIAFAAAAAAGPLAIAAVLAGLYPVTTVVLAQIVLHERLSRGQWAGVAAALVGVPPIAAGLWRPLRGDGRPREVQPGHARSQARPGQRVDPEVALQVE